MMSNGLLKNILSIFILLILFGPCAFADELNLRGKGGAIKPNNSKKIIKVSSKMMDINKFKKTFEEVNYIEKWNISSNHIRNNSPK